MADLVRPRGMFLVAFDLEPVDASWPPFSVERIWAGRTGDSELKLDNIPFYVRGLAYGDIIRARPDHDRREFVFDEIVRHSGHSTLRVILMDKPARESVLAVFRDAGCSWEFSTVDIHFAVDVPEPVNCAALRGILVRLVSEGVIEVEEAFIAEPHQG